MTYEEALEALYAALPAFHRIGAAALKPGLGNTLTLLERLGNPHLRFRSIHIAGTNGKGSSSHSLASVLQESGMRVGLYTSPHLKDYRERIRVNGAMIPKERVVRFVEEEMPRLQDIRPSFFEATVALCFQYFAEQELDVAVIETGLGGRLDSTNVITPVLSLITNIGYDHQDLLGPTLPLIAGEKAGIIKPGVPVVVSQEQEETAPVFRAKAQETGSAISFASERWDCLQWGAEARFRYVYSREEIRFRPGLRGSYQAYNMAGVLESVRVLRSQGWPIPLEAVTAGLERVKENTGLAGRWEVLQEKPLVVADTAHNEHGLRHVFPQAVQAAEGGRLTIVFGVVGDKDLEKIYPLLPREARYIFAEPTIFRKLPATTLAAAIRQATGLAGEVIADVNEALKRALEDSGRDDVVLVTGSTFLVGDLDRIQAIR